MRTESRSLKESTQNLCSRLNQAISRQLPFTLALPLLAGLFLMGRAEATQITFADFSDTSSLQLNGSAAGVVTGDGAVLELNPSSSGQAGSAFLKNRVSLANNASFSTFFKFRISKGDGMTDWDGVTGADGIVFVVQTVANNIGSSGGGIGYQGIGNSVGIEFDTWYNYGQDPSLPPGMTNANGSTGDGNHVAINFNGNLTDTIETHITDPMNNGQVWYAWVDYNGATGGLEVRLSEAPTRPAAPTLSTTVNLLNILGSTNAYLGFTAATGGSYNQQDILSWQINTQFDPFGTGADLALLKTASAGLVTVGSNLTYAIVVTNNGPADATGVVVTDPLPAGLTYVSTSASQGTSAFNNGTLTWNVGTLLAGATAQANILVQPAALPTSGSTNCAAAIDVMLVIDSSYSILAAQAWGNVTSFAQSLAAAFNISTNGAHFGIVDFSDTANLILGLSGDAATVNSDLANLPPYGGGTATAAGLATGQSELAAHARAGVGHVMVLVTDGNPDDETAAETAAAQAKNAGTQILCVGVGASINFSNLNNIASSPASTHVFPVSDFNALNQVLQPLVTNLCPPTAGATLCNTATVTSSGTDPNLANNTATACSTVTNGPVVLPNLTPYQPSGWSDKIVVTTSTNSSTDTPLLRSTDTLYVDWAFINQGTAPVTKGFWVDLDIDGTNYTSWYIDQSLLPIKVNGVLWIAPPDPLPIGSLSAGTHTITLILDSTNAIPELNEQDNSYTKTITVTGPSGADLAIIKTASPNPVVIGNNLTYTVVVTNNGPASATGVVLTDPLPAGVTYISATASQGTCSFNSGTVTANLGTLAPGAAASVNIVVQPTVLPQSGSTNCAAAIDVMLVIDSSYSILAAQAWGNVTSFAQALAASFNISTNGAHFGIVDFSDTANLILGLSGDATTVNNDLVNLPAYGGGTATAAGLTTGQSALAANGRAGVGHIMVLVTDGNPDDETAAETAATQAKNAGTQILCVGVGSSINFSNLDRIASLPSSTHVFPVSDFNALTQVLQPLVTNLCPPTAGSTLCNTATVTSSGTDPNLANNTATVCTTVTNAPALPNLTPYQPTGWSDKLVVTTTTNSVIDSPVLTTADTLYVLWDVRNVGTAPVTNGFRIQLDLDGVKKATWSAGPSLIPMLPGHGVWVAPPNSYVLGSLSAGTHTLTITADSTNAVFESDETDNSYTKTITVVPYIPRPLIIQPKIIDHIFTFSIPTQVGYTYFLEYKNSLADPAWTPLTSQAGTGSSVMFNDLNQGIPSRFYRIRVQ